MIKEKPINGKSGWILLVSSILAAMSGTGGGIYFYMHNVGAEQLQAMARPDPATGTQLRNLEEILKHHMNNHPDAVHSFDSRLTRIETLVEIIAENQRAILKENRRISP